ncbi:MAG: DNA polymerase IV, partial [Phycisphaerae bacterium]|nr:DNA polymerase IV [Gemmatimonadaceae bacterium]
ADVFFVAVARQQDPEGAGKATLLIVGGRPGSRGVVCSASYECRAFGVRSAMPIRRALQLCPDAMCVPVPRGVCSTRSRDIRDVLIKFAPIVQASSIDEWYLDMAGTEALYNEPLEATAHRIRSAVFEATGLNVSIGGGTSRLVAKMAVERAKPKPGSGANGVRCVAPGNELQFLADFKLADLPMVGPRFAQQLEKIGLVYIREAQGWSEPELQRRTSARSGHWLFQRVRGLDESIVTSRERQKQVSREETFGRDLHDEASLEKQLLRLAVRVSNDIRKQGLAARTVTVKLRDSDFRTRSARRTLSRPIESEKAVARVSRALMERLRGTRRVGVRLLGIALSHFDGDDVAPQQLAFFAPPEKANDDPIEGEKDKALTKALDRIRGRYGSDAILPARLIEKTPDTGPRVEE